MCGFRKSELYHIIFYNKIKDPNKDLQSGEKDFTSLDNFWYNAVGWAACAKVHFGSYQLHILFINY